MFFQARLMKYLTSMSYSNTGLRCELELLTHPLPEAEEQRLLASFPHSQLLVFRAVPLQALYHGKNAAASFCSTALRAKGEQGGICLSSASESRCLPGLLPGWCSLHTTPCSEDVPEVTMKPFSKGTNRNFTYTWSYGLCDVI